MLGGERAQLPAAGVGYPSAGLRARLHWRPHCPGGRGGVGAPRGRRGTAASAVILRRRRRARPRALQSSGAAAVQSNIGCKGDRAAARVGTGRGVAAPWRMGGKKSEPARHRREAVILCRQNGPAELSGRGAGTGGEQNQWLMRCRRRVGGGVTAREGVWTKRGTHLPLLEGADGQGERTAALGSRCLRCPPGEEPAGGDLAGALRVLRLLRPQGREHAV